jgi:hypothetical protein
MSPDFVDAGCRIERRGGKKNRSVRNTGACMWTQLREIDWAGAEISWDIYGWMSDTCETNFK